MFANFPKHLKLNAIAGAFGPDAGTGGERSAAEMSASSFRAPVYLSAVWRPVAQAFGAMGAGAKGILAMLWAMIRAILARIAAVFGVKANLPDEQPGDATTASFVSNDGLDGQQAVTQAAEQASAEVSKFTQSLLSSPADLDVLRSQGAAAYLALALKSLGAELEVARSEERVLLDRHEKALSALAAELGVAPDSLHDLVNGGAEIPDTGAYKELGEIGAQLQEARARVLKARLTFVDYCRAAQSAPEMVTDEVFQVISRETEKFADVDMKKFIFAPKNAKNSSNSDSSLVNSAKCDTSNMPDENQDSGLVDESAGNLSSGAPPSQRKSFAERMAAYSLPDDGSGESDLRPRMGE